MHASVDLLPMYWFPSLQGFTSFPVGTCLASLTLAKFPLPMVLMRRYFPMWGSSERFLGTDGCRMAVLTLSSVPCTARWNNDTFISIMPKDDYRINQWYLNSNFAQQERDQIITYMSIHRNWLVNCLKRNSGCGRHFEFIIDRGRLRFLPFSRSVLSLCTQNNCRWIFFDHQSTFAMHQCSSDPNTVKLGLKNRSLRL